MRTLAALCASLVLVACGAPADDAGQEPQAPPPATQAELAPMPPFATDTIALVDPDGEQVAMPVYVADEPDTRRQGLMEVTDLPREAGMLFLSSEDRGGGFWMKNTLIPLSIAFFAADGTILEVLDMEPCEADPCPTYDPGVSYRGALEVNQGRFDELGVEPGWRVHREAGLVGSDT